MSIIAKHLLGSNSTKNVTLIEAFNILLGMDLINIGEVGEQTISNASGVARCPRNTARIDLVSGVQIKTAQTYPDKGKLQAYFAPGNTKAPILLVVLERLTGKEYFFSFSYNRYKHQIGSSICLPFDADGTPRRSNHWWDNEIEFKDVQKLAKNA